MSLIMHTATQLFALARSIPINIGDNRCFYCGGKCDESILARDVVKSSFTSRDTVCGGEYVCNGCVAAMEEKSHVQLACGEVREGQKLRGYSWVVKDGKCIGATKSHRQWLAELCLSPPSPPFVICISDSGQKHLLYRSVVCHSTTQPTVTLEGERITYQPRELMLRIDLCKRLIAASGKPALAEPFRFRTSMNILQHHDDESLLKEWDAVREQPLSRLAIWLAPAKEECLGQYPPINRNTEHGAVPPETGGAGRSSQSTLFD